MAESVHLNRRGVLFVLSSPSGAGKTTISRMMLEADKDIALSISATTRPPRPGEIDGVHYHFVDTETFKKMAADGDISDDLVAPLLLQLEQDMVIVLDALDEKKSAEIGGYLSARANAVYFRAMFAPQ